MPEKKAQIAVIVGPTASGKTAASIEAAKALNAEIISADSVQIYKGLNIGSAKPDESEKCGIVHHLMDCIEPTRNDFTVDEFQRLSFDCIEDLLHRGKLPLIVGGTGLYIDALTKALDFTSASVDPEYREYWYDIDKKEAGAAHAKLMEIDSIAANRLHPNDRKRVVRALEIFHLTNKTLSEHIEEDKKRSPKYRSVIAGLTMSREKLYERIDLRVEKMREMGLVEEVESLLKKGCDPASTSMQGLGYKEIVRAILSGKNGDANMGELFDTAFNEVKQGTRRFAKRQWTWFKRDERIRWFEAKEGVESEIIEYFASNLP